MINFAKSSPQYPKMVYFAKSFRQRSTYICIPVNQARFWLLCFKSYSTDLKTSTILLPTPRREKSRLLAAKPFGLSFLKLWLQFCFKRKNRGYPASSNCCSWNQNSIVIGLIKRTSSTPAPGLRVEPKTQGRIKLFVGLGLFDNQGHIFHSILWRKK